MRSGGGRLDIKSLLNNKKSIVYLAVLLSLGIFLMLSSNINKSEVSVKATFSEEKLSKSLEDILSKVEGAGDVKVLINYNQSGEKIIAYETESKNKEEEINEKNQVVYDGNKTPFVLKEYMPTIEGVIIVAQGGNNEYVKNQLISGTVALLGIDSHKIEVLKMK